MSEHTATSNEAQDWRLRFGMGLSVLWVLLGLIYISSVVGWPHFVRQSAPDLGSFFEGAFAPLAFLWLVVGFFLQQRQLAENTRAIEKQYQEMRRSAEQAEIQSRAIAANEAHARQDTFMEAARMVSNQLGVVAGYLYMSSQGPSLEGQAMSELWSRIGGGDQGVFSRLLIALIFREEESAAELFWGTPIRTRHSETFIQTFERLLERARDCDPDGMLADALVGGEHGRLYAQMQQSRAN